MDFAAYARLADRVVALHDLVKGKKRKGQPGYVQAKDRRGRTIWVTQKQADQLAIANYRPNRPEPTKRTRRPRSAPFTDRRLRDIAEWAHQSGDAETWALAEYVRRGYDAEAEVGMLLPADIASPRQAEARLRISWRP